LIAFDLPGHGESSDAPEPERTYTMSGYAQTAVEVLQQLEIDSVIIFGWSLGGHVAIEMIPLFPGIKGILIVGTPPGSGQGFKPNPHMGLAAKEKLSKEEIDMYAHHTCGWPYEPWIGEAVTRTDGRARRIMFDAFIAGAGADQKRVVETSDVLCAVINGADEPFVDLDYVDTIGYKNLWEEKCHRLPDLGHAPFWEDPDAFAPLLQRFINSVPK